VAEEKRQFLDDQRQRNAVEGKFGQGKRRYGLGLIREKPLELLYVLFTCWLHLLWARGSVNNVHSDPFAAHGVMA